MILFKVRDIISKHDTLEKELFQEKLTPNHLEKSGEYSNLGNIIIVVKEYLKFDQEKIGLEQILEDKNNDTEILKLAEKDLKEMNQRKEEHENKLKIFLLPKDA